MEEQIYSLNSLVEEIMDKSYGTDSFGIDEREKDYQMILDYFKRLKTYLQIDLDKTTISEETKDKIVNTLKCLMLKNNGYYTLMKKVIDKKNVQQDKVVKLNIELNKLMGMKSDDPVIQLMEKKYNEILAKTFIGFEKLMLEIEESKINQAEKYNLLGNIIDSLVSHHNTLESLEGNNSNHLQKELSHRGKQNALQSKSIISNLLINIIKDPSKFPITKAKTSEEAYIIKYFERKDFDNAHEIYDDVMNSRQTISAIEDIRVKEIYIKAYPNIFDKERSPINKRLLDELTNQ